MKPLAVLFLAALAGCALTPETQARLDTATVDAAVAAEHDAACPTDNRGRAQLYGARALFDETTVPRLSEAEKGELERARGETDARCGLG